MGSLASALYVIGIIYIALIVLFVNYTSTSTTTNKEQEPKQNKCFTLGI